MRDACDTVNVQLYDYEAKLVESVLMQRTYTDANERRTAQDIILKLTGFHTNFEAYGPPQKPYYRIYYVTQVQAKHDA